MGAGKCVLKSQHSVQRSRTPARSSVVTALPHVVPHRPHKLEHTHAHARARVCVYGFVDLTCIEFTYIFFVFEPFESKLQRRISMCFLRARTFSYIVIQIRKCILVQYYYLNLPTLIKILPVVPDASFLAIKKYLWSKIPSRITSYYL